MKIDRNFKNYYKNNPILLVTEIIVLGGILIALVAPLFINS